MDTAQGRWLRDLPGVDEGMEDDDDSKCVEIHIPPHLKGDRSGQVGSLSLLLAAASPSSIIPLELVAAKTTALLHWQEEGWSDPAPAGGKRPTAAKQEVADLRAFAAEVARASRETDGTDSAKPGSGPPELQSTSHADDKGGDVCASPQHQAPLEDEPWDLNDEAPVDPWSFDGSDPDPPTEAGGARRPAQGAEHDLTDEQIQRCQRAREQALAARPERQRRAAAERQRAELQRAIGDPFAGLGSLRAAIERAQP